MMTKMKAISIFKMYLTVSLSILAVVIGANAQVDDICADFGHRPSLNSPFQNIPYVFGRIVLKAGSVDGKLPRLTVTLIDPQQTQKRLTLEKSGSYCFRRTTASSGTLIVEVDGVEVARRSLPTFGPVQQREDFEISYGSGEPPARPGVVSTKFARPPHKKTVELYKKASAAEAAKDRKSAIQHVKAIVDIDPADFIAWAKLGSLYFEQKEFAPAEAAFRKALELNAEYTPAWIIMGRIRLEQKRPENAIEIFKEAARTDPASARAFQLLGEAYIQTRQGTLGVQALDQAIRLDPVGMAECHLIKARLYDLAGAKNFAAAEYKAFLGKLPEHPDRRKFERYIRENTP